MRFAGLGEAFSSPFSDPNAYFLLFLSILPPPQKGRTRRQASGGVCVSGSLLMKSGNEAETSERSRERNGGRKESGISAPRLPSPFTDQRENECRIRKRMEKCLPLDSRFMY